MTTLRAMASIPLVAVLLLAGCGDDSVATTPDTTATPTTEPAPSTAPTTAAPTTAAAPDTTAPPETSPEGPVQIDVMVGRNSGPDRIVQVSVGSDITLNLINPDAADEFHVHGIDIEQKAAAGVMITLNFTIDTAGTYEVESHVTHDVLVVIEAL